MLEPRWSKPAPGELVPWPLLPEYGASSALHACDMGGLERALRELDRVARGLDAGSGGLPPIERNLARYLIVHPVARAQLAAATASPLTAYMPKGERGLVSMAEHSALDDAVALLPTSLLLTLDTDGLTGLARRVSGDPRMALRTGEVRTARDARGVAWLYPPPEAAARRAPSICVAYTACRGPGTLPIAVWTLAALLNAHPYPDANGRLARLLFAGALTRAGFTHAPVFALGPLIHASDGAFEIAVRRIAVQGRWQPLVDLLAAYAGFLAAHLPQVAATSGGGLRILENSSISGNPSRSTTGEASCEI